MRKLLLILEIWLFGVLLLFVLLFKGMKGVDKWLDSIDDKILQL